MAARGLGLVAVALVLAACGGGGGSSGGGAVGSATPQSGLVLPTSSGSGVIAEGGTVGGLRIVQQGSGSRSSLSFGGQTQTWQNGATSIGDLGVFQTTNGTSAVVTGGTSSSSAAAITRLEYTSYGVWLETSATAALTSSSDQITGAGGFVIGAATPSSDMPRAGTASYRGQAVAVELRSGQVPRTLSGDLLAAADFTNGRVNATADLRGAVDGSSFGRVTMNGLAISGNRFTGTASAGSLTGSVQGGFAGPGAAELGGSFELNGSSTVHGAFAGTSR